LSATVVEDVVEEVEPALPVVSARGILRGGGGGGGGGGDEEVMPSVSAEWLVKAIGEAHPRECTAHQ
jgi:hypothetical protein